LSAAWQVYLTRNTEKVNEVVKESGSIPARNLIAKRNEVAQMLFENENEDVQEQYRREAKELHDRELEKYRVASRGEPSNNPEDQRE
jgi:hypothetical protein